MIVTGNEGNNYLLVYVFRLDGKLLSMPGMCILCVVRIDAIK